MAARAASLMASGVPKSGSPAPKSITSMPSRRSRSTVAVTFIVGEPAMRDARGDKGMQGSGFKVQGSGSGFSGLETKLRLDHVGHETVHAAAEGEDFFDQARTDIAVLLGRHH